MAAARLTWSLITLGALTLGLGCAEERSRLRLAPGEPAIPDSSPLSPKRFGRKGPPERPRPARRAPRREAGAELVQKALSLGASGETLRDQIGGVVASAVDESRDGSRSVTIRVRAGTPLREFIWRYFPDESRIEPVNRSAFSLVYAADSLVAGWQAPTNEGPSARLADFVFYQRKQPDGTVARVRVRRQKSPN